MKPIRLISRIDLKGKNAVKGIQLEGIRVVGDPCQMAQRYYHDGADELFLLDVVASLYERDLDLELIKHIAQQVFIPITVGGRIRSIEQIREVLRSGADKVALNTGAIANPSVLAHAVEAFGAQCIVLSIEAKRKTDGQWEAYTESGRQKTGLDAVAWAKRGIQLGVGELLITSIDAEGMRAGFDLELMNAITAFSPVPVIAHGGAASPASIQQVIVKTGVDAVSAASMFHYMQYTPREVKAVLHKAGIAVRV
ncbi:imidazole glycerol phosphate synthase subunit HisF [Candidatus Uhrbacteria bacterium]|nr:imidazole glycerol phosphate synthase subunit HisF [Candidatus Uhrbacteria bacterium]